MTYVEIIPRNAERKLYLTPEQAHVLVRNGAEALLSLVVPDYEDTDVDGSITAIGIGPGTEDWDDGVIERMNIARSITNIINELRHLDTVIHCRNHQRS